MYTIWLSLIKSSDNSPTGSVIGFARLYVRKCTPSANSRFDFSSFSELSASKHNTSFNTFELLCLPTSNTQNKNSQVRTKLEHHHMGFVCLLRKVSVLLPHLQQW